jgi:hypothetical protein
MEIPTDVTQDELAILGLMATEIYQMFPDPIDKFIVAMVYELGYSKFEVSHALGISSPAITIRDQRIRRKLMRVYRRD